MRITGNRVEDLRGASESDVAASDRAHGKTPGKNKISRFDLIFGVFELLVFVAGAAYITNMLYHDAFPEQHAPYARAGSDDVPAHPTEGASRYRSRLDLSADGRLAVRESITVRNTAGGDGIQHGIHLALAHAIKPQVNHGAGWRHFLGFDQRSIDYDVKRLAVHRIVPDGPDEPLHVDTTPADHVTRADGHVKICLWCDGRALAPGRYRYDVDYATQIPLLEADTQRTFIWSIPGGRGWSLPIGRAEAVITLPGSVAATATRTEGWQSTHGNGVHAARTKRIDVDGRQGVRVSTTRSLDPGEKLSIAVRMPPNSVAQRSGYGGVSIWPWLLLLLGGVFMLLHAILSILGHGGGAGTGGGGAGSGGGGGGGC